MTAATSIDDLLGHEEEEPAPERVRRRSRLGWLVGMVLVAAGFTAVVVFGLRLFALETSVPAVFAGLLALLLLRRVAARVALPPPRPGYAPPDPARDDGSYNWSTEDALRGAVNRWENKLVWSKGETGRFAKGVLPVIGELVDERLRLRHGLTRASDPPRARALLGEELWAFLTTPVKRTPAAADLATIVEKLEKL
nr:hypothetical protein [Micromonospora sp. DSM 115978]